MSRHLPPYFDGLLAAYRAGQAGRDVHLGLWDDPPPSDVAARDGFGVAQRRLTDRLIDAADIRDGQDVLDVACGLGGTLDVLNARATSLRLTGVNIDRRQLAICRTITPRSANSLALVAADADALPCRTASVDRVLCVEAMFHFASRSGFLEEAARVLRPDGVLAVTDILLQPPPFGAPWDADTIAAVIRRDYGPWPDPWIGTDDLHREGERAGFDVVASKDWTTATLPSYAAIFPDPAPERRRTPDAGAVFRWMHTQRWLTYRMVVYRRR
ncbi:MAG: class I SAM-dependent methyltransferase [Acetobacteraceae bacterium]